MFTGSSNENLNLRKNPLNVTLEFFSLSWREMVESLTILSKCFLCVYFMLLCVYFRNHCFSP